MDESDTQTTPDHFGPDDFSGKLVYDGFEFDDTDLLLIAMLQDPVLAPEFAWTNPTNVEMGGCYRVRDYQHKFNRIDGQYQAFACARSVGKTERQQIRAFIHFFRRIGENMLITAPELLHLMPLVDKVEDRISSCRLTAECLKKDRAGKTGFHHNPFGVDFSDGTKIVGRIPNRDGRGVKGQHQPVLMVEEGQDYPDAGWTEVHESLWLDEFVMTPRGPVQMRHIRVGDIVLGADGKGTEVIGESPIKDRELWRVKLSDGTEIMCDADHLWEVSPRPSRTPRVMRTEDLVGKRWCVPVGGIARFDHDGVLPMDPYLLGLMIGDGNFTQSSMTRFSTVDPELVDEVRRRITDREELVHAERCDYRIRHRPEHRSSRRAPDTREAINSLGLGGLASHEKFVPWQYKVASIDERLMILSGLVDSDGNIHNKGAARFVTTSPELADDVEFIVRSLGGSLTRHLNKDARGHRSCYVLHFRLPASLGAPSILPRKASKYRPSTVLQPRWIESVEPTGKVCPVKCIRVADERGLFMTRNFVVTHNTVSKESGDFEYHIYGVHRGARGGGFATRVTGSLFTNNCLTAIQRPGWGAEEKQAAIETYGGENSPDYRRNILGEPGAASSPIFVTARLMAVIDQNRESDYNTLEYRAQHIRWEEFAANYGNGGQQPPLDAITYALDLPARKYRMTLAGADLGLTSSPTVISVFGEREEKGVARLPLIRRFTLERFPTPFLRRAFRAVYEWDPQILGIGLDITGLGFPIFQEIQHEEGNPDPKMLEAIRGWKFNEKIPVGVDPAKVSDGKDEFGRLIKNPDDPTVMMSVIEATTRYLREWVDTGYIMLPFDTEISNDLLAENLQRVSTVAALTGSRKPNAFHILDSFRMAALIAKVKLEPVVTVAAAPVLDAAVEIG